jgi:hypothetical protein
MKIRFGRPSPAMVVAVVALVAALSGSAYAALGKNSVGTRQLKAKAVTAGKIANNAVTSAKVAQNSLTGSDINLTALGTVPSATNAANAGNANTVGGHAASCPAGTTLIRGVCFDAAARGPAESLTAAEDACATAGGTLPSPMLLYATRTVLNLGTGAGTDRMYTDTYYSAVGTGSNYTTIVLDGTGRLFEQSVDAAAKFYCVYALVR